MRFLRVQAMVVITVLFTVGAAIDLRDRPLVERPSRSAASLTNVDGSVVTWFCPGGSGLSGVAQLTVELISAASVTRTAVVTAVPDPSGMALVSGAGGTSSISSDTMNTVDSMARRAATVEISPGERVAFSPIDKVPGAQWVGAVVEVDGPDVIVDQVVLDGYGGVGRSSCLTRTARRWVVPHGATRFQSEGERLVVMLLNPFPDFAVADLAMIADVGRDSIEGLVVPAGSVVAVDVTEEVSVASSVLVLVEAVSGQLAVSWIQVVDGPVAGSGTRMATASPELASLWYLPIAAAQPGRSDLVAVANPSADEIAEVDLEIIANSPGVSVEPIELSVPPSRSVLVDLKNQSRLEGLGTFTVVVHSLEGLPVAASIVSVTGADTDLIDASSVETFRGGESSTGDEIATGDESIRGDESSDTSSEALSESIDTSNDTSTSDTSDSIVGAANLALGTPADLRVSGTTATTAADAAAMRWLMPVEATIVGTELDSSESVGFYDDASNVVVVNPSEVGIALVDLIVEGEIVHTLELGPQRRSRLPLAWLGSDRFVLEVKSSSPVIVARELVGLTSRTASLGVTISEPVFLTDLL